MPNIIQKLHEIGQSVWCDNLSRAMLDSGLLQKMLDQGVRGVTSNPTIFMKAITGSTDYDTLFAQLVQADPSDMDIYEGLVLPDIRDGADILGPLYEESGGTDGFISLEVSPKLAYQTDQTIAEGRRLWDAVDRPNLMIKVPATQEGLGAIEALIGQGINVNVTLIFSINVYRKVIAAYLKGLKAFDSAGGDLSRVSSVASFFVSRLDAAVDKIIDQKIASDPNCTQSSGLAALKGKAAVANAKIAYAAFQEHFANVASPLKGGCNVASPLVGGESDFGALQAKGAKVQRPLWASTSTKDPALPDTLYVDQLIGPDTVNTMPPATLKATLDHGTAASTIESGLAESRATFDQLRRADIDLDAVTDQLLTDGVKLFAKSFDDLLADISRKRAPM